MNTLSTPTIPSQTLTKIGVIGGGQLAWMMGIEAASLGVSLFVQTPQTDDPAVPFATETILAKIDDATATAKLATHCDVITFENEFVDLNALSKLAEQGVCFRPRLSA
ncbi:MAG: 5-(carboxyamino)imidazole ribonucleotide synthase, partial [Planktothrix sp.]